MPYQIVVCGGLAPDPLQTLEPVPGPAAPALKNEMMLPGVLDPWASHALYEAAHLAKQHSGSTVKLVSLAPKAKLQQVLMTIAQKVPFELVALDGPNNGFSDANETGKALGEAIAKLNLPKENLLVFGGWESATRGSGVVMQVIAEHLGIADVFLAVDEIKIEDGGSFTVKERVEGGKHMVSRCAAPPAVLAWATGNLPEPPNHPQTGMANMRVIMPSLQKAAPTAVGSGMAFASASLPKQVRETRIVKDTPAAEIAREIAEWLKQ